MQISQTDNQVHLVLDQAADETSVFEWRDDANALVDLSTLAVHVHVRNKPMLSFEPIVDPDDAHKRVLIFDQDFSAALAGGLHEIMIDATYPDDRVEVLVRGTIEIVGWAS